MIRFSRIVDLRKKITEQNSLLTFSISFLSNNNHLLRGWTQFELDIKQNGAVHLNVLYHSDFSKDSSSFR